MEIVNLREAPGYAQPPSEPTPKHLIYNHHFFHRLSWQKIYSISCCDDDCCGLEENPHWCGPACNFFERCEVEFPADHWKSTRCPPIIQIRCTPHHSLSASFPRVLHSFSLRCSSDNFPRAASNVKRQLSIFLMSSTVAPVCWRAPTGSRGVRKHVHNFNHRRKPWLGS